MAPKISVCIASFNGEKYIGQQIESILGQLGAGDEVIVSDNGSDDATAKIVAGIDDERVNLVVCGEKGVVPNFEHALSFATGEYIYLSDQDDVWLPNKVTTMNEALGSYDLVVSDCRVVDSHLSVEHESFFALRSSGPGSMKNIMRNSYLGCTMAFNRKILDAALPFPKRLPMHDWWIGLIGEVFGKTSFVSTPIQTLLFSVKALLISFSASLMITDEFSL